MWSHVSWSVAIPALLGTNRRMRLPRLMVFILLLPAAAENGRMRLRKSLGKGKVAQLRGGVKKSLAGNLCQKAGESTTASSCPQTPRSRDAPTPLKIARAASLDSLQSVQSEALAVDLDEENLCCKCGDPVIIGCDVGSLSKKSKQHVHSTCV